MRRTPLFLISVLAPFLLAGCLEDSTSYRIEDGGNDSEHALTLRVEQEYFWDDKVTLTLVAARTPTCQRRFVLATVPVDELQVDLFSAGDKVFNLRAGASTWQVDTETCSQGGTPDAKSLGEPIGSFRLNDENKLVFDRAGPAGAPAAQPAQAAQ